MPWISVPLLPDGSTVAGLVGASDAAVGICRHPVRPMTAAAAAAATVQPILLRRSPVFMPSP
jgi:hypothetical protein